MRLLLSAISVYWLRLRMSKSFTSPGLMRWRRSSVSGGLGGNRRLDLSWTRRLHEDYVGEAGNGYEYPSSAAEMLALFETATMLAALWVSYRPDRSSRSSRLHQTD